MAWWWPFDNQGEPLSDVPPWQPEPRRAWFDARYFSGRLDRPPEGRIEGLPERVSALEIPGLEILHEHPWGLEVLWRGDRYQDFEAVAEALAGLQTQAILHTPADPAPEWVLCFDLWACDPWRERVGGGLHGERVHRRGTLIGPGHVLTARCHCEAVNTMRHGGRSRPGQETGAERLPCLRCGHRTVTFHGLTDHGGYEVRLGRWSPTPPRRYPWLKSDQHLFPFVFCMWVAVVIAFMLLTRWGA